MKYIEASRDLITERVSLLSLALYVNVYDRTMVFQISLPRIRLIKVVGRKAVKGKRMLVWKKIHPEVHAVLRIYYCQSRNLNYDQQKVFIHTHVERDRFIKSVEKKCFLLLKKLLFSFRLIIRAFTSFFL